MDTSTLPYHVLLAIWILAAGSILWIAAWVSTRRSKVRAAKLARARAAHPAGKGLVR